MADEYPDAPEAEELELLTYGTEDDLVEYAVTHAQAALPQWEPRVGNTEVVLIESLALMLGVEVMSIQMLGAEVVEQLMRAYGVTRDPGTAATGRVRFDVTESNPIQTVPAGTRLRYVLGSTGETVDVQTMEQLDLITSETLTGQVDVVAEEPGEAPNATPVGTELELLDSLPFVQGVVLTVAMAGGQGEESDESFNSRAAAVLGRLTTTLVSPESFQFAALTRPGIGRARVIDLYDPAAPTVESVGHVSVAVATADGGQVAPEDQDELEADLTGQALASLSIHVIAPNITTVDIAVTVQAEPGSTEQQVRANVTAAIEQWINPATWDWSDTVGQYSLVAIVGAAQGVKRVVTVPADQPLPGVAPLADLGNLTVTVTA